MADPIVYIDTRPVGSPDPDITGQAEIVGADGEPRRVSLRAAFDGRVNQLSYMLEFCDAAGAHVEDAGTCDVDVVYVDVAKSPPVLGLEAPRKTGVTAMQWVHMTGGTDGIFDIRVVAVTPVAATHFKLHVRQH